MHWRRKWQPTPYSCLENPRDREACWAAICGVAQSQTGLTRLSSSSSSSFPVSEMQNINRVCIAEMMKYSIYGGSSRCSGSKSCPTLRRHGLQHARFPCHSSSPGACSNSRALSREKLGRRAPVQRTNRVKSRQR